jgi:hypothetical protein
MDVVERSVSAGNGAVFDLEEFLSRPLYAHLAHQGQEGACESPVWFHWDGEALWIIGGSTFPANLKRNPQCAIGIVDWRLTTGLCHHVGFRGTAEVLPIDPEMARTIFRRYFGPDESDWDVRFRDGYDSSAVMQMIRFIPRTAVIRDQSYHPSNWAIGQRTVFNKDHPTFPLES